LGNPQGQEQTAEQIRMSHTSSARSQNGVCMDAKQTAAARRAILAEDRPGGSSSSASAAIVTSRQDVQAVTTTPLASIPNDGSGLSSHAHVAADPYMRFLQTEMLRVQVEYEQGAPPSYSGDRSTSQGPAGLGR
jgi:hypothetical protein